MRRRKMKNGEEYGIERDRVELMSKLKRERVGKRGRETNKEPDRQTDRARESYWYDYY